MARVPPGASGPVRLQKLLAATGVASRRGAEELIETGRVWVNGRPAKLGQSADPTRDEITLDGERLALEAPCYWLVNKPRGVLTTVRDTHGRQTIVDLLPRRTARVFPVGRLDRDTEGLVLLTNDGGLSNALLHPSYEVEREYRVTVRGELRTREQQKLAKGVYLEDGRTAPSQVTRVRFDSDADTTTFHLTLIEGRKRQIRRALLALGHPVRALLRVRMGPLRLGRLPRGAARELRPEERGELERLRSAASGTDAPADAQQAGRSPAKKRRTKRKPRTRSRPVSD